MSDTPETAFVRGSGGGLIEVDVPTKGHALERWREALAKGDLSIVDKAHWVDRADGSKYLVEGEGPKPTDNSRPVKANFTGKQPQTTSEA